MGNSQEDSYRLWEDKQRAVGRNPQVPILPIPEIYTVPDIGITLEPHDFRGAEEKCSHRYTDGTICGLRFTEHGA